MASKFCTQCGNTLNEGASFCRFCGAPVGTAAGSAAPADPAPVMTAYSADNSYAAPGAPAPAENPYYDNGPAVSGASAPTAYTYPASAPAASAGSGGGIARKIVICAILATIFVFYFLPWYGLDIDSSYKAMVREYAREAREFTDDFGEKIVYLAIQDSGYSPVEEAFVFPSYAMELMAHNSDDGPVFLVFSILIWLALAAAIATFIIAVIGCLKGKRKTILGFAIFTIVFFVIHIFLGVIFNESRTGLPGFGRAGEVVARIFGILAAMLSIGVIITNFVWKVSPAAAAKTAYSGYPYDPAGTPVNPYDPAGMSVNPYGPVDTPVNPYGPVDTPVNPYGPVDTPVNPYGPVDTPVNPYGPVDTPVNPYGPVDTPVNPYGPVDTPADPYGPAGAPADPYGYPVNPPAEAPENGSGALHLGNLSGSDNYMPDSSRDRYENFVHEPPKNMKQAGDL